MIGEQKVDNIEGVVISAVSHEGLRITVGGKPAMLAVISEEGVIVAAGAQVAREAEAVSINSYRRFLQGEGFLRVLSASIDRAESGYRKTASDDMSQGSAR